jgi:hypothetical protein
MDKVAHDEKGRLRARKQGMDGATMKNQVAKVNRVASSPISMVSVVVSIRTRRMFAEVREMLLDARLAEQDVRERRLVRTSEPALCLCEPA